VLVIGLKVLIAALASNPIGVISTYPIPYRTPSLRPRGVVLLAANDLISNAVTALPKNTFKNTFLVLTCGVVWRLANPNRIKPFSCAEYFHYIPKCWESVVLDHTIDYIDYNDKNI
jgi:hypothetical protein